MAVILASLGRDLRAKKKKEKRQKLLAMEKADSQKENPEDFLAKISEGIKA